MLKISSLIVALLWSVGPLVGDTVIETSTPPMVSSHSVNDFSKFLQNTETGTIVSLDIPWEPGDTVGATAEAPLEWAFTDYNGNDVYYNSNREQVYSDRSSAADATPIVEVDTSYTAPQNNSNSTPTTNTNSNTVPTWDGVSSRFYPTYNCDIDCARLGLDNDYLLDIHNEMWMDSGPFQMILGHNYLGMGSKVHKLVQGDIVEIYGSPMNGRWKVVGITWTPKYGAFYEDIPKYSNYALQTCETDDRIRFVFLERA